MMELQGGVMTKLRVTATVFVAAMAMASPVAFAQPAAPAPSGHWEGSIELPDQPLAIQIDLAKKGDKWDGTITIPAQKLKGFPLGGIEVSGDKATFAISGAPGNPVFSGDIAKDGQTISGTFTQGGGTLPFKLTRSGDAKFEAPPKSTPVTKDLEGSWAGTLDVDGKSLRLVLKLTNASGGATGTLVSVDQNGAEIPITAVVQKGTHLSVTLRPINGSYEGDLKDGQLVGTWTQGTMSRPLTFARSK
jgi:hypothetical protein